MEAAPDRGAVLAQRIRERQAALGLKGVEIAAAAKIPRSYLSELTNNSARSFPKAPLIQRLARALRCDPAYLTGETAEAPAPTPYDRNPMYRKLIDVIDRLPSNDRTMLLSVVDWLASRAVGGTPNNVLEFVPAARTEPEAPKEMSVDEMRRVAKALGDVVEFRKGALWHEYDVPLVATVSAGKGIEIFETYEKVRQIPEYYWKAGARAVFKVQGDSMRDMSISDNDLLFVKPTTRPKSGEIVVCTLNGMAFVKEIEKTKKGIRLLSRSEGYDPIEVGEQDRLEVYGVVLGRTGNLSGDPRRKK